MHCKTISRGAWTIALALGSGSVGVGSKPLAADVFLYGLNLKGKLSINGTVNLNTFRMTVTGTGGETALTNIVSGSGASNILKQGSGVLTLGSVSGANTFSASGNHNIFMDNGTVQMAADGGGGTTNGTSTGWIDVGFDRRASRTYCACARVYQQQCTPP